MVITYSKGKNQPSKVANPARGQLNRENEFFSVPVRALKFWVREIGSAVLSRVSLLVSKLSRLNLVLTYGFLPSSTAAFIFFLNHHTPWGQSRVFRVT